MCTKTEHVFVRLTYDFEHTHRASAYDRYDHVLNETINIQLNEWWLLTVKKQQSEKENEKKMKEETCRKNLDETYYIFFFFILSLPLFD